MAHIRDRGRLEAILVPGRRLWLNHSPAEHRRTEWTALLAETPVGDGGLVSLDTTLPNRLVRTALEAGVLGEFDGWTLVRPEWMHGGSRFDFLLARPDGRRMALEVKSVGYVEGSVALFPDAVTARGVRHLQELSALVAGDGWEAGLLFVVQREDAGRVRAASHIDPAFAAALTRAREAGVRVLARRCMVGLQSIALGSPIPAE